MTIEELPHTADIMFRIRAPDLAALFAEAARALMQVMYGPGDRPPSESREIVMDSDDTETLLRDFLSEIIYVSEVEGLVFSEFGVTTDGSHLAAVLKGSPFDAAVDGRGTDVKGISSSGLRISREGGIYQLEILFDV